MPNNESGYFIWEGTGYRLPDPRVLFVYKNGNDVFEWIPCDCKEQCNRPNVFTKDGKYAFAMTIRARGNNQGHPILDVLLAVGNSVDQIANNVEKGISPIDMFASIIREIGTDIDSKRRFIDKHHINIDTFEMAVIEFIIATSARIISIVTEPDVKNTIPGTSSCLN